MRVVVIVDGGFLKNKYRQFHAGKYPTADEVADICANRLMQVPQLAGDALFRIYFYDCFPYDGEVVDPVTRQRVQFGNTPSAQAQITFLHQLMQKERLAVRSGTLSYNGWKVHPSKIEEIVQSQSALTASDLIYDFKQKQLDIMIGLDIALMAQKKIMEKVVIVAGDSDLVPAMAFARNEGCLVYLCTLGHPVKFGMIEHSDGRISLSI